MKQQPRTTVPVFQVSAAIPKERMGDYLEFLALNGTMEGMVPMFQQEGKPPVHRLVAAQQEDSQVLAIADLSQKRKSGLTGMDLLVLALHRNGGKADTIKIREAFKEDGRALSSSSSMLVEAQDAQMIRRTRRGEYELTGKGAKHGAGIAAKQAGAAAVQEEAPPEAQPQPKLRRGKNGRSGYSLLVGLFGSATPDHIITNKDIEEAFVKEGLRKKSVSPQVHKAKTKGVLVLANGEPGKFKKNPKFNFEPHEQGEQ